MVNYRYLGYGITNDKGIAKLEFDENGDSITHSYAGTGAGKFDIVASLDDSSHISESSIQSETYEVLDCYKADTGMTDYSDIWTTANATLSRDGDYSTIKETSTSSDSVCAISNIPFANYHLEVDVYQVDGTNGNVVLQLMNSDYSMIQAITGSLGEWKHISLDKTDLTLNSRIRLVTGGTTTETRFKNFKVYPI